MIKQRLICVIFYCFFSAIFIFNRESLFQPVFKNKITQSPCPVSQIRFSTFGYDSTPSPPPPPLSQIPPPPNPPIQTSSMTIGPMGYCPAHFSQGTITPPKPTTLPHQHHQHQHHHHYHHVHNPNQNPGKSKSNSESNSEGIGGGPDNNITKVAKTALELQDYSSTRDPDNKKFIVKKDDPQSRSFSDIRKSAPDVIIMTSTSSH